MGVATAFPAAPPHVPQSSPATWGIMLETLAESAAGVTRCALVGAPREMAAAWDVARVCVEQGFVRQKKYGHHVDIEPQPHDWTVAQWLYLVLVRAVLVDEWFVEKWRQWYQVLDPWGKLQRRNIDGTIRCRRTGRRYIWDYQCTSGANLTLQEKLRTCKERSSDLPDELKDGTSGVLVTSIPTVAGRPVMQVVLTWAQLDAVVL